MSRQSEQILEEQLIAQLQKLGYQYVSIADENGLHKNLKWQFEKYNQSALTKTGSLEKKVLTKNVLCKLSEL